MGNFYDGTKLLSLKDINGNTPELYICTSNRTAGKSCWFNRYFVNKFKKDNELFGLIYRFDYELDECANKFFGDIQTLFFNDDIMTSKKVSRGMYSELYLNDKLCGFAIALNKADQIKKCSHAFSKVKRLLMDEFQSETNKYCPNEIKKLLSIHTSIARGGGEQVRYVPTYLVGNPITLLNPYYVELGISSRLTTETKFLKGDGYVLEQGYNETADLSQRTSAFNRAFSTNEYVAYSSQGIYLNDNLTFIEKPLGTPKYIATIKYNGCNYSIKEYTNQGILYCDNKYDVSFPFKISITTDDHQVNYVMLKKHDNFIQLMKYFFDKGCFRFKDLKCKETILKMLSY